MGYLKGLPSELVQTFGSGTGLSGFTGVITVLVLSALGVSQGKAFLFLGLFVIPYFLAFSWIDDKRRTYVKDERMYPELDPHAVMQAPHVDPVSHAVHIKP
jgi:hypothetical protein